MLFALCERNGLNLLNGLTLLGGQRQRPATYLTTLIGASSKKLQQQLFKEKLLLCYC